jgi:hypothetical protein
MHYIVSTNGDRFHHPDDIALARVVTASSSEVNLWFNYDTPAMRRWDDNKLKSRYNFATWFPDGAKRNGVCIPLPAASL